MTALRLALTGSYLLDAVGLEASITEANKLVSDLLKDGASTLEIKLLPSEDSKTFQLLIKAEKEVEGEIAPNPWDRIQVL